MQNKFDFYKRIGFDEKKFLNLFKPSKALDLIVLPNNFIILMSILMIKKIIVLKVLSVQKNN
jgi:hypothetical protein